MSLTAKKVNYIFEEPRTIPPYIQNYYYFLMSNSWIYKTTFLKLNEDMCRCIQTASSGQYVKYVTKFCQSKCYKTVKTLLK